MFGEDSFGPSSRSKEVPALRHIMERRSRGCSDEAHQPLSVVLTPPTRSPSSRVAVDIRSSCRATGLVLRSCEIQILGS